MDINSPDYLKIPTEKVLVKIFTSDFEIEGYAHVKPGGYATRLVDLLNLGKLIYLPITEAKYTFRGGDPAEIIESNCVIVHAKEIEIIDIIKD